MLKYLVPSIRQNFRYFNRFLFSSGRKREDLLKQLDGIKDSKGVSINKSGYLHSLEVQNENTIKIKLQLTKQFRKLKSLIETTLKQQNEWIQKIQIDLAPSPKQSKQTKHQGLQNVKKIIAVSSCKGGVGKSTVAVNLAFSLSKLSKKVGILDADVYGPSLPTMISPTQRNLYSDPQNTNLIAPIEYQGVKTVSYGFASANRRAVMRGPIVTQLVKQLATQTNWGELDFLVIDLPPGTGDIQITLCQQLPLSGSVIVTTPQRLSFVDVVKGIQMFDDLKVPTLAVVENMSYIKCKGCSDVSYPFGKGYTNELKQQFGIKNSFQLPIYSEISKYSDEGTPFVMVMPESLPIVKAYQQIAEKVIQQIEHVQSFKIPMMRYDPKSGKIILDLGGDNKSNKQIDSRELRLACKCALCIDQFTGVNILKKQKVPNNVYPLNMIQKGNYAVAIVWSDGHNSSLYPYERLINQF